MGDEPLTDPAALRREHTPEVVAVRLSGGPRESYARELVYGAVDGAITTFAVVAGARGASLAASVVVALGFANLVADGFSMSIGNYLGVRTAEERRERVLAEEHEHIERVPDGEREEIRQIFRAKGFTGEDLDRAVEVITADRDRWAQTMMVEEHGFASVEAQPWKTAAATFGAFCMAGVVPLLPFVVELVGGMTLGSPFAVSAMATGLAFLLIGAVRGRVTGGSSLRSALQTLALGGTAASLAFGVGLALRTVV
ncbi:MAG: VIT1/CCC1 transporter family protein [Acidimicrobiales bacterium]|nr:VIT1/CCC1 transporter family protein [Acidimicrobiales bacterium]